MAALSTQFSYLLEHDKPNALAEVEKLGNQNYFNSVVRLWNLLSA
jgi:hypothetical protein